MKVMATYLQAYPVGFGTKLSVPGTKTRDGKFSLGFGMRRHLPLIACLKCNKQTF